jgi:hypothetical protein
MDRGEVPVRRGRSSAHSLTRSGSARSPEAQWRGVPTAGTGTGRGDSAPELPCVYTNGSARLRFEGAPVFDKRHHPVESGAEPPLPVVPVVCCKDPLRCEREPLGVDRSPPPPRASAGSTARAGARAFAAHRRAFAGAVHGPPAQATHVGRSQPSHLFAADTTFAERRAPQGRRGEARRPIRPGGAARRRLKPPRNAGVQSGWCTRKGARARSLPVPAVRTASSSTLAARAAG